MDAKTFDLLLERRTRLMKEMLASKGAQYATGNDRLHNFTRAAAILGVSRPAALLGMLSKHLVSILDMVDNFENNPTSRDVVDEKIGDAINYLVLLEAIFTDGRQQ